MATIFDVAKYILSQFPYGISTMKLQKLSYFAQGWTLAVLDEPLFQEDFEAWVHGPVSRPLFEKHKGEFSVEADTFQWGQTYNLNARQRAVIDAVIQNYGALSGNQMSDVTHEPGPWAEARTRAGKSPGSASNVVIEKQDIKQHFKQLLNV